jgi:hypothetical protein
MTCRLAEHRFRNAGSRNVQNLINNHNSSDFCWDYSSRRRRPNRSSRAGPSQLPLGHPRCLLKDIVEFSRCPSMSFMQLF